MPGREPFGPGPSCWGHNNSSPGSWSTAVYKVPCSYPGMVPYLNWCHCCSYRSSCIHWRSNQWRYSLEVDPGLEGLQAYKNKWLFLCNPIGWTKPRITCVTATKEKNVEKSLESGDDGDVDNYEDGEKLRRLSLNSLRQKHSMDHIAWAQF